MVENTALTQACQHIDWLLERVQQLMNSDLQQALDITTEVRQRLNEGILAVNPYEPGKARALLYAGMLHFYRANYEETYQTLLEALSLFHHLDDTEGKARALGVLGATARQMGDFAGALEIYHQQLDLYRQTGDRAGEARAYNGLSSVHSQLNENVKALNYLLAALAIVRDQGDIYAEATLLGNACNEYLQIGQYEKALEAGQESLRLFHQADDRSVNEAQSLLNLAQVYRHLGQLDDAFECVNRALAISREHTLNSFRLQALNEQGRLYILRQQYDRAETAFRKVLDEARALHAENSVYATHLELVNLYKATGNYEKALYHYEAYQRRRETIFNEESDRRIRTLEIKLRAEAARKEAEFYRQRSAELEDQREQEQQYFDRLNRLKDELIRNTSHDLKNPLGGIHTTIYMLEKHGRIDDDKGQSYLHRIKQLAERMNTLLQDMIDMVKLETGRALDRTILLLNPLIEELTENFSVPARAKGIRLEVRPVYDELVVLADLRRIRQVLQTLVFNAIRSTPVGGVVTVSADRLENQITVRVRDTGPGILPEDLPEVFTRFARIRRPDLETIDGLGLSLAIAKTIIEQHEGSIHVRSEPNQGCLFWFILPVAAEETADS